MNTPAPPHAALGGILRRASHLILDFHGPVCDLPDHQDDPSAADQLRGMLRIIPVAVAAASDPLTVLAYIAASSPDLAEPAEAELARYELNAISTAQPTGYSHDLITSAHEGHRTVTIISTWSTDAVNAYLTRVSLDGQVSQVLGRIGRTPAAEQDLIERALTALDADPATCAAITRSAPILDSANSHGVATIAYAPAPSGQNLTSSHMEATVSSLGDLVLRLRARPLPN